MARVLDCDSTHMQVQKILLVAVEAPYKGCTCWVNWSQASGSSCVCGRTMLRSVYASYEQLHRFVYGTSALAAGSVAARRPEVSFLPSVGIDVVGTVSVIATTPRPSERAVPKFTPRPGPVD